MQQRTAELFERKIGTYQCASIPGRGQVYGKTAIENWIRKNPGKTRIAAKGDVRKCYPSINRRKLKRMLEKQVRNEDLLYLTFVLIDSFDQGLSIGSYLSQWLCNYYLSAAYHYAAEKLFKRKKHRDGTIEEIRLINHVLFYMDDFLLIGSRKADVRKAMKLLVKYMNEYLDLTVKPDWKLFQIDWIDKDGKQHGEPIDMMGFKIYRDRTEVRRSIFLRGRRAFVKAGKYVEKGKAIPSGNMTKLQIISRQWSSIYDLLLYIKDKEKAKPLEDIQQDLDIIEYSCRKYADVDDEEISMENEQISRAEHEEFRKRIEAEDNRQNRRIEILENSVQQLQELVTSVQTLANNMENMVKEQGQQSARLEALESRDGEKWRTVTSYLLTAILGIAVGIIAKQFGI